jgi:hypothetical protein
MFEARVGELVARNVDFSSKVVYSSGAWEVEWI